MDISNLIANVGKTLKSNAPEILTALGISGVVTTAYLTARASFHAARLIEEHEGMNGEAVDPRQRFKERARLVWKEYIPPTLSGGVTIACIIGSHKLSGHRTAAAVAAYSLTEKAFSEYKEKVVQEIGKGKEQKVRDEIAQDVVNRAPEKEIDVLVLSDNVLCCELYTGRTFRCDMESLRKAENDLNKILISQVYASLDEFYDIIGLPYTSDSTLLGWDSDNFLELKFSTTMSPKGEPCLAFAYNYVKPIRGL